MIEQVVKDWEHWAVECESNAPNVYVIRKPAKLEITVRKRKQRTNLQTVNFFGIFREQKLHEEVIL